MVQEVEKATEAPEAKPQTTTQEDLTALRTQLEQTAKELEQTKKGLSTAHQTLTEKDKELKKRQDLENTILGIEDRLELLATAIASGVKPDDMGLAEARPDVMKVLQQRKQEQEAKRKEEETKRTQAEYTQRASALYAQAKEAFGDNDDEIEKIEDYLFNGRIDRAEARIAKALKAKETKTTTTNSQPATPKESDDERINKLVADKLQKELEKRGLLSSETNLPAGGNLTAQEAMSAYIRGEISADEAKKRGAKF